jgi:sulfur-oxidizing protein SoxY
MSGRGADCKQADPADQAGADAMSSPGRRRVMRAAGGAGLLGALAAIGWLTPAAVQAQVAAQGDWNAAAFDATSLDEVLRILGATASTDSNAIRINAPDVSETGPAVPVAVTSGIPGTDAIVLLVGKNPTALSALVEIPAGTEPYVNLNLRISESGPVMALVRAGGRYYHARREVTLTVGGCGD